MLRENLRVTERAMERIMIGVAKKDRVTNEDLRHKSRVNDFIETVKSKKLRWTGHLLQER